MLTDIDESNFELTVTPIELIGYAKNDILKAEELTEDLPEQCIADLKKAYYLLDKVQEFLFQS